MQNIIATVLRKPRPFAATQSFNERRQREAIRSIQERIAWENEEIRNAVLELGNGGLSVALDIGELRKTLRSFGTTAVFSLVTKEYLSVGENWASYISALGLKNYVLFCGDRESYEYFHERGIPCAELNLPDHTGTAKNFAGFHAKGLMMASMKFPICRMLIEEGFNVVFSDLDAFWIRNPMELLEGGDHDVAFQNIYIFPREVVRLWGFAACSGFFFIRNSEQGLDLVKCAHDFVIENCDDQVALNLALLKEQIRWEYHESEFVKCELGHPLRIFWQPTRSGHGIYTPVRGTSSQGTLIARALPQALFRRHMFMELPLDDVHIFHPNSPKSDEGKLEVFERYGFPVTRVQTESNFTQE